MKRILIILLCIVLLVFLIYKFSPVSPFTSIPKVTNPLVTPIPTPLVTGFDIQIIASGLDTPWALAFLPDGKLLITERPGRLRILAHGKLDPNPITISDVYENSEGGLLGLAVHPNFTTNHYIYLYQTYKNTKGIFNRVDRYVFENNTLSNKKTIIDDITASSNHDGGRLKFGPDGKLYITSGDAYNDKNGQDKNSLNGKILRINDDGSIPSDNPFGTAIWTYGHRNPEGLAFQPGTNSLFSSEHGPSAHDEINIIQKGNNYGWPVITGDQKQQGMITPIANSGLDTWAPAGATFYNGDKLGPDFQNTFLFTGLRSNTLWRIRLNSDNSVMKMDGLLQGQWGRMRDIIQSPDGYLYIANSNLDGRGNPTQGDDRILKIVPKM
jgi:glucose/arabinose dehydrogenase